jgi:low temperature requirement protein LtrA
LRELGSVRPLELFFDLVFVLAFTQCTTLMVADPSWGGIGRGVLVLAVLWWAWVGYAWLTSVIEPEEGAVRIAMFAVMAGLLVAALCVPEAFDDRGLTFAVAYGVVRAGHIVLFVLSSREDRALRQSVAGLAVSSAAAVTVLGVASSVDGGMQALLWVLAITVDFAGPALIGVAGWRLVPDHFAERHNLMIILALGESIVSLGVAAEVELTAAVVVAAVLGVALASALWWIYFDVVALVTEQRLAAAAPGRERNSLARDSYSYLHFPMVAGIVVGALGLEEIVAHVDEHLDLEHATAVLGGTALYLLGHVALRLRSAHTLNRHRLAVAVLLVLAIPAATSVRPLVVLGVVNALVWAMIATETAHYGSTRPQLRHHVHPHGSGPAQEQPA